MLSNHSHQHKTRQDNFTSSACLPDDLFQFMVHKLFMPALEILQPVSTIVQLSPEKLATACCIYMICCY